MNRVILLELANKWERESIALENNVTDGSEESKVRYIKDQAYKDCKRECAEQIRSLITLLGE